MKARIFFIGMAVLLFLSNCSTQSGNTENVENNKEKEVAAPVETVASDSSLQKNVASSTEILAKKQIPVLCYHQIREWRSSDSKTAKDVITPLSTFKDHIKTLADSGYTSILPDQLYDYLVYGTALPEKPVMITFDDNDLTQYEQAAPILKEYGFKGVFFIMTVTIGRPRYMSKAQLKELSDDGNVIASHTWDHHDVRKYSGDDWITQIEKPSSVLEEITGRKVEYFAYPFGAWNPQALPELEKRGMKAAFILATKRDENMPLFTIRRMIASGYWNGKTLENVMEKTFALSRN